MKKVIFVGMHNKPGKDALDSSTMTGKTIDKIIEQLPNECVKTNLCDTDYQPPKWQLEEYRKRWMKQYNPDLNHVVVLLGRWVQKNLPISESYIVLLKHPGGVFGRKDDYIKDAVTQIKNYCT